MEKLETQQEEPQVPADAGEANKADLDQGRRPVGDWSRLILRAILLTAILLTAAYLRFTGINWDEGLWIHPDEAHMQTIASAIRMPDRLSLYFDTHNSPLNWRNHGHRYSYGSLPMFLTRATAEWLDKACGETSGGLRGAVAQLLLGPNETCNLGFFTSAGTKLIGRALSALSDLGTLVLVYLIGRRLYGEAVGMLAAALGAFTAFATQQAHFFTVDSMACFFTVLTAYISLRASRSGSWGGFALAGVAAGLATACKVSAAPAVLLVALAGGVWLLSRAPTERKAALWEVILKLGLAGLLAFFAFRVAQPYSFEGPGFFGLRLSPEWLERLGQIQAEQSGEADYPSGRQWANRASILFPLKDMVFWGMGLPLGLVAWAAWAVMGIELWRGRRGHAIMNHVILWGWSTVLFLYHATRWVKTMRTFLPLYPLFAIFAAYLLVRLCRARLRLWRGVGFGLTALAGIGTALWAVAVFSIYLRPHTRLISSRWIFENIPQGSTLANEHWDWGPPLRVDGKDPFGGMYTGFEMQLYDEDTWDKRERLYEWLDQTDYIILGSNRLYASISRLPARYPLTIEYYRALFAGELGFELLADFTSRPALGPFQFPDQEEPFPLVEAVYTQQTEPIEIVLPPADEAWSVYDHPRVLIFRKTDAYSRQLVEQRLGGIDVERAMRGLAPRAATMAPNALMFDAETWADQQAGGTWAEMFNRDGLLNRYPGLAVVVWWVVVAVLGWLTFPLLFVALPRLRDRGYGMARVLGLLLVAYGTWLLASLRVLPNTRGTIALVTLLLALVGGGVGYLKRDALRRFVHRQRSLILWTEGLFALLYLFWVGVRFLHPDLWHTVVGGEKPMDLAYLNAVMKSTWFPPYNPWFSGGTINYYYFGFVIVGTLIKLIGTVPTTAYNLTLPLLYALTGVGAFCVAYNLFGGRKRGALLAGVMALAFTVLLGNLGVVWLLRNKLIEMGGELFPSTIPGFPEAVAMLKGLWQVIVHGAKLPVRPESWYWEPTRIIPQDTGSPIAEFPAFTFLYGDLHAHMIAFPLTLLAIALAVYWIRTSRPSWLSILVGSLVVGALRPTNLSDYPTYLGLGLAALGIGAWLGMKRDFWGRVKLLMLQAVLFVGLTSLFYLPYIQNYAEGYGSLQKWEGGHTPVGIFLWIHGILLFPVATRLAIEIWRAFRGRLRRLRVLALFGLAAVLILMAALLASDYEVALVAVPLTVCAGLLFLVPGTPSRRRLLWLLVGLAMTASLAVEIIVIKNDIGRLNTVFKFYLQVWILLAVAAGVSVAWVREWARCWRPEWRQLWWVGMALLIAGGALFLPFSIHSKAIDRIASQTERTLDGMAFMRYTIVYDSAPGQDAQAIPLFSDYEAIRWMYDKIPGSPVILEGLGYREYLWANRVSIYTGLPAVVGWSWHQRQQRIMFPSEVVEWRRGDVNECYNTTFASRAYQILARYGVRYVYVGDYERAYYNPAGLDKFDAMVAEGRLRVAYDAFGVKIYEVLSLPVEFDEPAGELSGLPLGVSVL